MASGSLLAALDRALLPADAARRSLLLVSQRLPLLDRIVARRESRVLAHALLGATIAFAMTLACPAALFVLGPALLGVVHLASDARYLVLRRRLPGAFLWSIASASTLLLLLRALEALRPGALPFARIEVALGWSWALCGLALGMAAGGNARRTYALGALLLVCAIAAQCAPVMARVLFAYAHNLVALLLWVGLFRHARRSAWPVLGVTLGGALLLVSGALQPHVRLSGPWAARMIDELLAAAPRGLEPRWALGLGLSYVFLQSVHYGVWLGWIPQEDLRGQGTLSFRMSLRSLRTDFGAWPLGCIALLALSLAGASLFEPHRTRALYLSLASFHGYLELAAGAFLATRTCSLQQPGCTRSC